jgi:hypothetical protein
MVVTDFFVLTTFLAEAFFFGLVYLLVALGTLPCYANENPKYYIYLVH